MYPEHVGLMPRFKCKSIRQCKIQNVCAYMCAPFPSGPGGAAEAPNVGPSTLCSYRQRVPGRRAPPTSDLSRLLTHFFVFLRCQKSISVQPRYGPKGQAGSRLWITTAQPLCPPSGGLPPLRGRAGSRLWITTAPPLISHSSPLGAGGRVSEEAGDLGAQKWQNQKKQPHQKIANLKNCHTVSQRRKIQCRENR